MTETRNVGQDVQAEILKTVRRSQEAVVEAIRTWADTVRTITLPLPEVNVPFIPGLRDLPRLIPLHRLIWRTWYRSAPPPGQAGSDAGGQVGPGPRARRAPDAGRPSSHRPGGPVRHGRSGACLTNLSLLHSLVSRRHEEET